MAQVNMPRRQRRDSLDTILKGLQIAGQIYGIKDAETRREQLAKQTQEQSALRGIQTEAAQLDLAEKKALSKGEVTPSQKLALQQQGVQFVPEGTTGSVQFGVTSQGEKLFGTTKDYRKSLSDAEAKKQERLRDDQNLIGEAEQDFIKRPRVRDAEEKFNAANQVKSLLGKGQAVLDQVALRNIFRMSGDVGAIRAEDLRQLGADPAILSQMKLFLGRAAEGQTILPQDRKNLAEFADIVQDLETQRIEKEASNLASSLARRTQFNEEELRDIFNAKNYLLERVEFAFEQNDSEGSSPLALPQAFGTPQAPQATDDVINKFLGE